MTPTRALVSSLTLLTFLCLSLLPVVRADAFFPNQLVDEHFDSPSLNERSIFNTDPSDPNAPLIVRNTNPDDPFAAAPPHTHQHEKRIGSGGPYWYSQITRQGKIAYGSNDSYILWRNVKDYGATGDGVTDDTYAIGNATTEGNRCDLGCKSSTILPAIVYFPPGVYIISETIFMLYNTAFIGDANNLPVLKGSRGFNGIGLIESDRYLPFGGETYANQNNFWRQVRNFEFDITESGQGAHCIHWQVAQATSLQNLVFRMAPATLGDGTEQIGMFMDNGSGGMMEDLIFYGGNLAFLAGNQQFSMRNITINDAVTGIFQNWCWVFLWKEITFNRCHVGFDMTQGGGDVITPGSVILQDTTWNDCDIGIQTRFSRDSKRTTSGTMVLDHVNFVNTPIGVERTNITGQTETIVPGNQAVEGFIQGRVYSAYEDVQEINGLTCHLPAARSARIQQPVGRPPKPAGMLDANGNWLTRGRPQYEGVPVQNFKSILDYGCVGDGLTDDTACVIGFIASVNYAAGEIAYVDHGAYLVTDLIVFPNNMVMVGEFWPIFMISGAKYQDEFNPQVAFRVGQPGDIGTVEISEILFETRGPTPGAILMEWNLAGTYYGATGMWDTHWRLGGSAGTLLQSDICSKTPQQLTRPKPECMVAFLVLHLTATASLIMNNNWGWIADHELDRPDENQINIYQARGILVESQNPVIIFGGSFEHCQFYNYNVANAKNLYMGVIQSETAYMQNNPDALAAFALQPSWYDPTFQECTNNNFIPCYKTYALRIFNSNYIFVYGAGLYSFFQNYKSDCLQTGDCQAQIVSLEESEAVYIYALNTYGALNMVEVDFVSLVPQNENQNTLLQTVALFEFP